MVALRPARIRAHVIGPVVLSSWMEDGTLQMVEFVDFCGKQK
jgi:hypothetical protein